MGRSSDGGLVTTGFPLDVPVAAVRRGGLFESVHRGRVAACDTRGEALDSLGDPGGLVCLRSCAKPFQALPLVFSGAADALGVGGEELAVVCGSHSGEPRHLAAVRTVLRRAGLSEGDLQNGFHAPMYAPAAARLSRNGETPRAIHGNCSGKHAGMLAVCAHAGWDTKGYRDPEGPLQKLVRRTVAKVCGVEPEAVRLAGDGCGVPAFALPLENLALGFARLAAGGAEGFPEDLLEAMRRVRDAMLSYPYMVAGTGRFDTTLARATGLIVKGGAEGVFACGSAAEPGWGLALKVSDGASRAVVPAALAALERRGVEVPDELAARSPVTDLRGETVGEVAPLQEIGQLEVEKNDPAPESNRTVDYDGLDWRGVILLGTALQDGLLEAVAHEPRLATEVARDLRMDPRAAYVVLSALGGLGVLDEGEEGFWLREEHRGPLLDPSHPDYAGGMIAHRHSLIEGWICLPWTLETGEPAEDRTSPTFDGAEAFIRALRRSAKDGAGEIANAVLSLVPEGASILDVGGGPGTNAEAFAQGGARVTIFDRPGVIRLMGDHLSAAGIETVAGDMNQELPEGLFDAIYFGNTSHMYGPEENRRLLAKMRRSLVPGGILAIREFVRGMSSEAALFAVNMLVLTPRGGTYAAPEYTAWLEEAGFADVRIIPISGLGTHLILARNPG